MKSKTKKIPADDGFNPELVLGARFEGISKFPCIEAHRDIIVPDSLIPFSKIEKYGNKKAFVAEYEHILKQAKSEGMSFARSCFI